jgi:hypothetical protein
MPVGAFGIRKYVVFNTREGMTKPGQWYLDRTAGRLFYWPLPDEDMARLKVVAPVLESIIRVAGNRQAPVEKITLRGFSMQATTTPLKPAGFGAGNYDGALHVEWARDCIFEKLEICNVGGLAMRATDLTRCQIRDNQIHHTGAAAIRATGSASEIARNQIHHTGMYHPSAVGLLADHYLRGGDEQGIHIYRNEIHDTPYSGIIGEGGALLIEENRLLAVTRGLHPLRKGALCSQSGSPYAVGGKTSGGSTLILFSEPVSFPIARFRFVPWFWLRGWVRLSPPHSLSWLHYP